MSQTLAIFGFGRMGAPITRRLVSAGFHVTVHDPAKQLSASEPGVEWMDDVGGAASCDVIITILPGAAELQDAMLGADGVLAHMSPGSLWLDLTSGDPAVSARIAENASAHGIRSVSAPMGGGPSDAETGTLSFFIGGEPADVADTLSILGALGDTSAIRRIGVRPDQGQTAKLLANHLWFGQAAAVTEALLVGKSAGIDLETLSAALADSAGGSYFLSHSVAALLDGDYLTSFALRRCLDELESVARLATQTGTPFAVGSAVLSLYRDAVNEFGDVDGELLVAKLIEQRAGRSL